MSDSHNYSGPSVDLDGNSDKFYILTTNFMAQDLLPPVRAGISSPTFSGKDHPNECFSFWFYFQVSRYLYRSSYLYGEMYQNIFLQKNGDGNKLELSLIENDIGTVIWTLDDFYVKDREERWYAAQVGVAPPNPETNYQVNLKLIVAI